LDALRTWCHVSAFINGRAALFGVSPKFNIMINTYHSTANPWPISSRLPSHTPQDQMNNRNEYPGG